MNQRLTKVDSCLQTKSFSQCLETGPRPTLTALLFLLLTILQIPNGLLSTGAYAQATLDGDTLTIPTVVIDEERYTIVLRIKPDTDPMQLDVVSAVATNQLPTPSASTFANNTLIVPTLPFNGNDYWLSMSTVSMDPPVLQLEQTALDDADDDNDGRTDFVDAFPYDPNETDDTDSDGIGNNADTDDDNDGVLDADDALPLVANYSEILALTGNFSAGNYLEEAIIEPIGTATTNEEGLGRYQFSSDGSLTIAYPEGNQSGSWSTVGNTLVITLQDGLGVNFTTTAVGTPDYLAEQVVIEPVPNVSAFTIRQVIKRRELQLVETSGSTNTYRVADHVELSILNDEVNMAWFGTTSPAPLEVTFESTLRLSSQPDTTETAFTSEQLVEQKWALPLRLAALGPNQLVFGTKGPLRESLADDALMLTDALVSFQSGGVGMNESTGQAFNWSLSDDGSLNVTFTESGDVIALQITQALQHGFEVTAMSNKSGKTYFRKALAMQQASSQSFNVPLDEYLVRNFYVYSPDNISSDGRIKFTDNGTSYVPFKAIKFSASSAIEHTTVISSSNGTVSNVIRPVAWELDGNSATLSRKANGSCEVTAANCVTERREWQLLNYTNGRLYILEETFYPATSGSDTDYELGQFSDIEYYDVYNLSAEEQQLLMQNAVDFSNL